MKYRIAATSRFQKEYAHAMKQGRNMQALHAIVDLLASDIALPEKNRDHALSGSYAGFRECHISPDWLLVYRKEKDRLILTLARIGSHSDLF